MPHISQPQGPTQLKRSKRYLINRVTITTAFKMGHVKSATLKQKVQIRAIYPSNPECVVILNDRASF